MGIKEATYNTPMEGFIAIIDKDVPAGRWLKPGHNHFVTGTMGVVGKKGNMESREIIIGGQSYGFFYSDFHLLDYPYREPHWTPVPENQKGGPGLEVLADLMKVLYES